MIVNITNNNLSHFKETEWASLLFDIVKNAHFVQGDRNAIKTVVGYGKYHCSTWQKKLIVAWEGQHQHLTDELKTFLTALDVSKFSYTQLHTILHEPSYLMVENLPYENIIYKSIIGIYSKRSEFKNLFTLLDKAKETGYLKFYHAGGYGNEMPLLEFFDKYDYKDVVKLKFCVLMDRDTESSTDLPDQRDNLFLYLSGKDKSHLTNSDIYNFTSPFNWHIWYKRAIENYFPETQYQNIGIDTTQFPVGANANWDYREIKYGGYKKKRLPQLTVGMSRSNYEQELEHFTITINGEQRYMSEFELLLLKLVRII